MKETLTPPGPCGHLADLLAHEGLLDRVQLDHALTTRRKTKRPLAALVLDLNLISEEDLEAFLARRYALPCVTLAQRIISTYVTDLVPAALARKHEVLPFDRAGNVLTVAVVDPTDVAALDAIAFATGLDVRPVLARRTDLRHAIERHYSAPTGLGDVVMRESSATVAAGAAGAACDAGAAPVVETPRLAMPAPTDLLSEMRPDIDELEIASASIEDVASRSVLELKASAGEAPVIKIVSRILLDAIDRGASDVHIEPHQHGLRVRLRIDGILYQMLALPKSLEPAIISRLKVMADLDIAERRLPQDGRIKLRHDGREIDVRVSIMRTVYGEKSVLRLLDVNAMRLDLSGLGFTPDTYAKVRSAIGQPYGMVLITGPTGAGKTTTLYSAINTLNSPDVNIMTVEDPVEYQLRGVNQVQINEAIGRTFAGTLRSFLRQDPDVILVGEMRDAETAQISVRAALTGHLVLSTLHTNDCASTLARLTDIGVPPFLVASALLLVIAQRLVRKVCDACAQPVTITADALAAFGIAAVADGGPYTVRRGKGCLTCNDTGFKGREALYEVMPMTEELRDAVSRQATTGAIRAIAEREGMRPLRHGALDKVLAGVTTVEEALRVSAA